MLINDSEQEENTDKEDDVNKIEVIHFAGNEMMEYFIPYLCLRTFRSLQFPFLSAYEHLTMVKVW